MNRSAMSGITVNEAWSVYSVHEISLSQGQYSGWLAGEKAAIGTHFVGLRVYFHAGRGIIQNHRTLADLARVGDRKEFLCKAKRLPLCWSSAWLTNVTELSVKERPNAPNMGR